MQIKLKWLLSGALGVGLAGCGGGGDSGPTVPPSNVGITIPAPVAGQSELLFRGNRASDNASQRTGLFAGAVETGRTFLVPVVGLSGASEAAWLPGRRELLYRGFGGSKTVASSQVQPGIRRVNRDGSNDRQIILPFEAGRGLAVSPDGQKVAYGARFVIVVNVDGTNRRVLGEGGDPTWSPDGRRLAYSVFSSLTGNSGAKSLLHVMNADGSNPTRIPTSTKFDTRPDWSPDGRRIVFESLVGSGASQKPEIFIMNADGSNRTRLTNNGARNSSPKWTPDGTRIVFTSGSDLVSNPIWIMNADGSNQTRLREDRVSDFDLR